MDLALVVVPVKGESDVSRSFPLYVDFVVALQDADEVVRIFLTHVFYSEVVDGKYKADGLPFVLPEGVLTYLVTSLVCGSTLLDELPPPLS